MSAKMFWQGAQRPWHGWADLGPFRSGASGDPRVACVRPGIGDCRPGCWRIAGVCSTRGRGPRCGVAAFVAPAGQLVTTRPAAGTAVVRAVRQVGSAAVSWCCSPWVLPSDRLRGGLGCDGVCAPGVLASRRAAPARCGPRGPAIDPARVAGSAGSGPGPAEAGLPSGRDGAAYLCLAETDGECRVGQFGPDGVPVEGAVGGELPESERGQVQGAFRVKSTRVAYGVMSVSTCRYSGRCDGG